MTDNPLGGQKRLNSSSCDIGTVLRTMNYRCICIIDRALRLKVLHLMGSKICQTLTTD